MNSKELKKNKKLLTRELNELKSWANFLEGYISIIKKLDKDVEILDLGCGNGSFGKFLLDEGFNNITVLDFDDYRNKKNNRI